MTENESRYICRLLQNLAALRDLFVIEFTLKYGTSIGIPFLATADGQLEIELAELIMNFVTAFVIEFSGAENENLLAPVYK